MTTPPSSPVPAPEDTQLHEWLTAVAQGYTWERDQIKELVSRLRSQVERMTGEQEKISRALTDSGIGGIFDVFENPADAITQMGLYIKELESGRSSDSETGDTE